MADAARLAATTIADYVKGEEVNVLRNRKILAMILDRGRMKMNCSGLTHDWRVRYRQASLTGFADNDTITFSKQNRWKSASLPWRGYVITDQITEFEKEKNKGEAALINVYKQMAKTLMEDAEEKFGDEVYIDGEATGNTDRFHGIESFFSTSGAGTKQPIGLCNDTYAGLVTTLANYGGTWSATGSTTETPTGDWPTGTGDSSFDFWTPLVVDFTSAVATSASNGTTGWAASTKTWPNTCLEALRYGITHTQKNKSKRGLLDLITLESEMYRQFKDKAQAEEQLTVTRNESMGLAKLGFADSVWLDGVEITSEYGLAKNTGYGWNFNSIEMMSLLPKMFNPYEVDKDITSLSERFLIRIMGNMKFVSPRQFCKFAKVT